MAKENPYETKALLLFYDDVENSNMPLIKNTPECKAIYLRAFSLGLDIGIKMADSIYQEEIALTISKFSNKQK